MCFKKWLGFIVLLVCSLGAVTVVNANKFDKSPPAPFEIKQLLPDSSISLIESPLISIDNELATLYSSSSNIIFQKGKAKTVVLKGSKARRFWLQFDGKYLYAAWWVKFENGKGKQLFISVSEDKGKTFSSPQLISREYGVLPTVSIASSPDGVVMVTYHDERKGPFRIYSNFSKDAGKTWQAKDVRVDEPPVVPVVLSNKDKKGVLYSAFIPHVFLSPENKAIIIWEQMNNINGKITLGFKARQYDFEKSEWSEVSTIGEKEGENAVEYNAFQYKGNILVTAGIPGEGVSAYLSQDSAENWHELGGNVASTGKDASRDLTSSFSAVGIGDDFFVTYVTVPHGAGKNNVMLSKISLVDKKWDGEPRAIDAEKDNSLTRQLTPKILKLGNNTLLVVWTEFKAILPAIYANFSLDQGKTWLKTTKPLTAPGKYSVELMRVVQGNAKAWIIGKMTTLEDDKLTVKPVYEEVSLSESLRFSHEPNEALVLSQEEKKKRLEKRVKKFWKLRTEKKHEELWGLHDQLFRAKFGKSNWLRTQGKIEYSGFDIKKITIKNKLFAEVEVEIKVKIPKQKKEGAELPEKELTKKIKQEWGWFYDEWYAMPSPFFMKIHNY